MTDPRSTPTDPTRCQKRVYSGARWDMRGHMCEKPAKRDGWCTIHHPDAVKIRAEREQSKWDSATARAEKRNNEALRRAAVVEAALAISDGDWKWLLARTPSNSHVLAPLNNTARAVAALRAHPSPEGGPK